LPYVKDVTITDINTTIYEVTGLNENQKYYAKLILSDLGDHTSESNVVGTTTQNLPPPKPTLGYNQDTLRYNQVELIWSYGGSSFPDFQKLEIYRKKGLDVTVDPTYLLATITQKDVFSYLDSTVESGEAYSYVLCAYDTSNLSTESNAMTIEVPSILGKDYAGGTLDKVYFARKADSPISLRGDLEIVEDGTLIVEAGTEIQVSPKVDVHNIGSDVNRVEILVKGKFISEGTESDPVLFKSAVTPGDYDDWSGFILYDSAVASECKFDYVHISNARRGIYLNNYLNNLTLSNMLFSHCTYGIYIVDTPNLKMEDSTFSDNDINGMYLERSSPSLLKIKVEYNNAIGVYLTDNSNPIIQKSNFNLNGNSGIFCVNASDPQIMDSNFMTNENWAIEGGGILGVPGGHGNYIYNNNKVDKVETTVGGHPDGVMDINGDQVRRVDVIYSYRDTPYSE
jgi:hypothetical protein